MSRISRSKGVSNNKVERREKRGVCVCERERGREARESERTTTRRREERNTVFRPREGSTNRMANEYRVWIREEPIGVRDVLPRSREKRQSGVLTVDVAHGKRVEGRKGVGKRG